MVEGEHGEKGFHVRFGPQPMDLIIVARRLACGSSKSRPCSLSRIGVGKTRVRSAETLVNGGFLLSVYAFFFSLLQSEKRKGGVQTRRSQPRWLSWKESKAFPAGQGSSMVGFNPQGPLCSPLLGRVPCSHLPWDKKKKKKKKQGLGDLLELALTVQIASVFSTPPHEPTCWSYRTITGNKQEK